MKKITFILFALFTCWQINAQVAYNYGWEPTGLGGWTNAGTGTFARNTATPCLGAASARANVYYDGTNTFTSPLLGVSNGGVVTFAFDYKVTEFSSNTTGAPANTVEIIVQRSSSTSGPWTTVETINSSNHIVSSSCATKTVTFSQEIGNLYVRFLSKAVGASSDLYFRYDNIVVSQGAAPSCLAPTTLAASNVTSSSVDLSWVASSGTQTDFEYVIQAAGAGIPSLAGTPISASSVIGQTLDFNGVALLANTSYEFYVRANCGAEYSSWSGPVSFRTACNAFTVPFTEGFNSTSSTEACWNILNVNADADAWSTNYATNPFEGDQAAMMYTDGNGGVNNDWLISPTITLTGNQRLKFQYRVQSDTEPNDFELLLSTTGNTPASFTNVLMPTTSYNNITYVERIVDLSAYSGNANIAWHIPNGGLDGWRLYIDNVIVEDIPSCVEPNSIIASNITSSSVDLSWTDGSGGLQLNYQYVIQAPGTGVPTGAGTQVNNVSVIGQSFDVNGNALTENTSYEVYVRADCGADFSTWIGPVNFRTLCTPYSVPYFEGFESGYVHNSTVAGCLSQASVAGGGVWTANSTFTDYNRTPRTGSYNAFLVYSNEDWMFIPIQLVGGTSYRVSLHARQDGATAANSNMAISYGTSNTALAMTNSIVAATGIINGNYQEIVGDFIPATSGTYYVGIKGFMNGTPWYISLDDISITESPSCLNPNTIIASNITSNSVDLSWTDGSGGLQFDYEYVIQASGTGEPTTNGAPIDDITVIGEGFDVNGNPLTANTLYEVYVRSVCGAGDFSTWSGPITFRTLCDAITTLPHSESFDAVTNPSCWSTALVSGVTNWAPDDVNDGVPAARTGARFAGKSWLGNDDALLISPLYNLASYATNQARLNVWIYRSANGLATDRITFYANTVNNLTGATMLVDVPLPISSAPVVASAGWYNYIVDLPLSFNTVGNFYIIAEGRTSSSFSSYGIGFDDYVLELVPASAPSCASNVVATPNATCGNFANSITWDASVGAEGYYVSVGTTSGGTDIANATAITTNTYSFSGNFGTTYFYTIVPYNAIGSATGCTEQSFTTNANGCYCTSVPTSNDGNGITNVLIAATNFPTGDVTYFDHTSTTVDLATSVTSNVQITFATGFTYNTYILIDFNDDFDFDDVGELVYSGVSTNANPTTLNASFVMPGTAPLGAHRMRIVTADDMSTVNPCYSGDYGVILDFTVNIVAPSCAPPVATSAVVYDCTNSQFSMDVIVTDLGNGSPVITDGTSTWPVSAIGTVNVGPFAFGTPVTLSILHGTDATCNLPLGTFNYAGCPPVNDDCDNAVSLTVNADLACSVVTSGTTLYATDSGIEPSFTVSGTPDNDVWFSFVATGPAHRVSLSNVVAVSGFSTDMGMAVFDGSGSCDALVLVGSSDPNTYNLTGLTVGVTYYVSVYGWGSGPGAQATFDICVGTPPAPPANDDCINAEVLTPGGVFADNAIVGTNVSATSSTETAPGCASYLGGDVWYSAVVPASGSLTFELNTNVGGITDGAGAVYSGTCGSLVLLGCNDSASSDPNDHPLVTVTNRNPGEVLYFRVWEYSNDAFGTFKVSAYDASLSSDSFNNANFSAYPNPVKDVLNISYTTEISSVRVINMIGQEVLSKNINATSSQVDMSQLSAGTYIVNVSVGDAIKTLKVVKQ